MKPVQWIALAALALVALLALAIALTNRTPPKLPADADHGATISIPQCLQCHGPGGSSPRPSDHPIGNDCGRCHAR